MLSKKAQYGLKALGYLAAQYGRGPVPIAEIARQKMISVKFLESILLELKHHNILSSKKGKAGGYELCNPPKKTSIASAIRILEGPIALLPCVSLNFYERCTDCDEKNCGLHRVMASARDGILTVLEKKTLNDLQ